MADGGRGALGVALVEADRDERGVSKELAEDVEMDVLFCSGDVLPPRMKGSRAAWPWRSRKAADDCTSGLSGAMETGAYCWYLCGGGTGGDSFSERGESMRLSADPRLSQLLKGGSTLICGRTLIGSGWNVRFSARSERPVGSGCLDISGDGLRLMPLKMSSKEDSSPKESSWSSLGGMAVLA